MAKIGIGLDMGTDTVKVVAGQMKKDLFIPLKAGVLRDGGQDLAAFLGSLGLKGGAMLGVTGKDMIIRYTQVTPMPDWQLKQVMGFEIDDLAIQSGGDLSADFNRLEITSSLSEDDAVLLALIKNALLDEQMARLQGTKVQVESFTPNAIALYNLISRTADVHSGTSLILGMGAENIDLVIVQDGALIFARNLSGGSSLFNKALMDSFGLSAPKAEKVKRELGSLITRSQAKQLSPQEEKVGRCLAGPAGQIYSMVQSSLMFCKAQIKVTDLKLDQVFLTGGGSRLKSLDAYLSDNLGVPVHRYDPAEELDVTRLENVAEFTENGPELAAAAGLAYMSATPDHYAIHVLPEAVKKRQYFKAHTLFGILAAVLLVAFLGVKLSLDMSDAAILKKDKARMSRELSKRERWADEMQDLYGENARLVRTLNAVDEKTISTLGLARTFALIQEYLPQDLWITSIEIDRVEREEFNTAAKKKPVIVVHGSGREMGQPLQTSFTDFRTKLDADPLTSGIIPQVRYGEEFTFSLMINYTLLPVEETDEEEDEEV